MTQNWVGAHVAPPVDSFAPAGTFSPVPQTTPLPADARAGGPVVAPTGGVKRRVEPMALATFLPTVVYFVPSFIIVLLLGAILDAATGFPALVVVLLWIAGVGLMFTRQGEGLITKLIFKARKPTGREMQVFQPAWHKVCAAAGQDPSRYSLWVEDSRELNAAAAGGHVVMVTRTALALPTDRFEAILAHELGHHLGGHSIPLLVNQYFMLPVSLASRVPYLGLVLTGSGLVMTLTNAAGRKLELNADKTAAELGFGEPLLDTLQTWLDQGQDDDRQSMSLRARMGASHPPISKRILQLENVVGTGGL
jgi:Zn-dependent protease with chaperone function